MSERGDAGPAEATWKDLMVGGHLPVFLVLCLGIWLHAADSLLVATVMPSAVGEIGGVPYISWTIALYQLGSIVAGAATGLAAVRFGLRNAMVLAAFIYAIGCVASALAPDMAVMLIGRGLQGIGGGFLLALAYVAISQLFPAGLMPRLMAIMSGVWGASALCGPLIGGFFASIGLWRLSFWAFAVQAVLLALAVVLLLRRARAATAETPPRVPYRRMLVLAAGIMAIALAGAEVSLVGSTLFCLGGVLLLALLFRLDRSHENSLFPSQQLDPRHTVGAGMVMILACGIASMSFVTYGPLLMEVLFGADPLTAGYMVAVESVAWTVAALLIAGARPGSEALIIRGGSVLITVGVIGFAVTMPDGPLWALIPWAILQGAGFGFAWGFIARRVVAAADSAERGKASAALPTTQLIGFAIGAAASGIVANAAGFADGVTLGDAETVAFWVFAAFIPIALVGNVAAWRLSRDPHPQPVGTA